MGSYNYKWLYWRRTRRTIAVLIQNFWGLVWSLGGNLVFCLFYCQTWRTIFDLRRRSKLWILTWEEHIYIQIPTQVQPEWGALNAIIGTDLPWSNMEKDKFMHVQQEVKNDMTLYCTGKFRTLLSCDIACIAGVSWRSWIYRSAKITTMSRSGSKD